MAYHGRQPYLSEYLSINMSFQNMFNEHCSFIALPHPHSYFYIKCECILYFCVTLIILLFCVSLFFCRIIIIYVRLYIYGKICFNMLYNANILLILSLQSSKSLFMQQKYFNYILQLLLL